MKLNFLPQLQMVYDDLYSACEDVVLPPHIDPVCITNYTAEFARIRQGAYIHKDYYAALIADPTDATLWTAGITSGKIILTKNLRGAYDGGTPKTIAGFGDIKEYTSGYDCVATVNDQVYKENYAFYEALAKSANYHFAFKTSSQIHISAAPVSISVKNNIADAVDEVVTWEATIKWFQQFTPAPHDMPAGIF